MVNGTVHSTTSTRHPTNSTCHALHCNGVPDWVLLIVIVVAGFVLFVCVSGVLGSFVEGRRRRIRAAATELESLRSTRRGLAREDLQKSAVERINGTEGSLLLAARKDGLQHLAPELRIMIYSKLDYKSAVALACTNRFYYNDTPTDALPKDQRATYVYYAESFTHNKRQLACYGCLRVLPVSAFAVNQWTGAHAPFGVEEFERRCTKCIKQNVFVSVGWKLREVFGRPKAWRKRIVRR